MMARSQLKPRLIFWRCVDLLIREKVQTPSYFRLSELILKAINNHKNQLNTVIKKMLPSDIRASLDGLFVQSTTLEGEPIPSKTAAYKLTLLKKMSQSTKPSKVKERVTDLALLKGLYESLETMTITRSWEPGRSVSKTASVRSSRRSTFMTKVMSRIC